MAHEIDMSNDRANMAFAGSRAEIWHGLGQQLSDYATIETWRTEAGLDWDILESPIAYTGNGDRTIFPDSKALYRSDTVAPLSIVGADYHIVQPYEVLEFFRDLVENHDMKLSAAGSLYGGKKFWATAEIGKSDEITSGDVVNGFLLLTSSADGSLATTAKFSSVRTVCSNTLNIALNNGGDLVKVSHRAKFDASQVKLDLGIIDSSWDKYIKDLRNLANMKICSTTARNFIADLVYNPNLLADEQPSNVYNIADAIFDKFVAGMGNDGSTRWDLLNGITEYYTHEQGRTRTTDALFWNNFYGNQAKIKSTALSKLLEAA